MCALTHTHVWGNAMCASDYTNSYFVALTVGVNWNDIPLVVLVCACARFVHAYSVKHLRIVTVYMHCLQIP